jgi:AraC family transcriptional regulator of adaptative response/methylated-DNA-[protein]-cysteine methyltransferase
MKQWSEHNTEIASGYSLHDPNIKVIIGETDPSEYRDGASVMHYGFAQSPFGEYFMVLIPDGIVRLKFTDGRGEEMAQSFKERRGYTWMMKDSKYAAALNEICMGHATCKTIKVCVEGTPFQKKVWGALLTIPFGETITYGELARRVGQPTAVRAVASAVAKNSIAYIIPCHRVVRSDGSPGQYRWGSERKAAIIAWEKEMKEKLKNKAETR